MNQGSDAGRYSNDDIHAVRVLAMEPTTDRNRGPKSGRQFYSHAQERLRVLGEIPLRKFEGDKQPLDTDGHPDTSFLAKIPADTAFTFQTLDKEGMVLNMAQTWHQVRPGEIRNDCGGCHAHSQQPTLFETTAAARAGYKVFDLTAVTPLITSKKRDESKTKWDAQNETGLRYVQSPIVNVEYHRDIKPILARSCAGCHSKGKDQPAGNLVLDGDDELIQAEHHGKFPGTYLRLALDHRAQFGYKAAIPATHYRQANASRYVRKFQSRRSLLVWKILGRRTDGWSNDDFPSEAEPGNPESLQIAGQPVEASRTNRDMSDLDFTGSIMPPPDAVKAGQAAPLSDEDRRTLIRWIDLGCPIDLDFDPARPDDRGFGWMTDDNRPVLTLTEPLRGENKIVRRILIGMYDYYSGLDPASLTVTADFPIAGVKPGENLAGKFARVNEGVLEWKLSEPITSLNRGTLTISVRDKQGNISRIERTLSVVASTSAR